ncbi:MAG: LacI family DNA-binding transcriptional regulator [Pseudomonadota bacterium]
MRDVAEAAGVSRMTVSRALREDSPVSPETRDRILKVVRDMNYVPDQLAGSLTTKRSRFVAVLVPSLNNLHFGETVQALTEELEAIGQQILLGYTAYSSAREEQIVEAMIRRRPEAIVMSYDGHTDRTMQLLSDASVPVIELWERPDDPIQHTVGFSNHDAAAALTNALIDRGYRNIAFLGEADDAWTRGAARRRGWQTAMENARLSTHRLVMTGLPPLSIEDGAEAAPQLLERFPDIDCLFCVSDAPAFGALSALTSAGIKVPDDIGIAGFGDFEVSRFSTPGITTVSIDPIAIGRETGRLLSKLLDQEATASVTPHNIPVAATLTFRGSTR